MARPLERRTPRWLRHLSNAALFVWRRAVRWLRLRWVSAAFPRRRRASPHHGGADIVNGEPVPTAAPEDGATHVPPHHDRPEPVEPVINTVARAVTNTVPLPQSDGAGGDVEEPGVHEPEVGDAWAKTGHGRSRSAAEGKNGDGRVLDCTNGNGPNLGRRASNGASGRVQEAEVGDGRSRTGAGGKNGDVRVRGGNLGRASNRAGGGVQQPEVGDGQAIGHGRFRTGARGKNGEGPSSNRDAPVDFDDCDRETQLHKQYKVLVCRKGFVLCLICYLETNSEKSIKRDNEKMTHHCQKAHQTTGIKCRKQGCLVRAKTKHDIGQHEYVCHRI